MRVTRARDNEFSLRYDSRINGLPRGNLVDGLPRAASESNKAGVHLWI